MKNIILASLFCFISFYLYGQPAGFNYTASACAGTTSLSMVGTVQINSVIPGAGSWIAAFDATNNLAGSSQLFNLGGISYIQANQVNTDEDFPVGPPNNCEVVDAGIDGYPGSPEQFFIVIWNSTDGKYYQFPNDGTRTYFNYVPDGILGIFIAAFANFNTLWSLSGNGYNTLNDLFNMVLPVELIKFEGKHKSGVVYLHWATATELNNSHFDIERSADGRVYEAIGRVKGAGDYQGLLEYEFTDEKPHFGLNYYRLRQVDYDGAFEYSNVVAVEVEGKPGGGISVFPNPAAGQVEVGLPADLVDKALDITIRDLSGRVVLRQQQPAGERFVQLPLDGVPPGYYTVNVQAGSRLLTEKLIVE